MALQSFEEDRENNYFFLFYFLEQAVSSGH